MPVSALHKEQCPLHPCGAGDDAGECTIYSIVYIIITAEEGIGFLGSMILTEQPPCPLYISTSGHVN